MYRSFGKRLFDLLLAVLIIVITAPVFVITWILLLWQNKGSAFFIQERPGRNLKAFYLIKFKTMNEERDSAGVLLPDNQRLTKFGSWIRKLSIDELPQLINVIKGEMSLVGPRPLLFKYVPLYSKEQNKRHDVKPGITGWAQVNGRNSISWSEKFKYDIEYVNRVSFYFDLKILWITLIKVLKREGINQSADRPMQPFNGSN